MKKTRKQHLNVVKPITMNHYPTLCPRCGVTNQGIKIDFTTTLSVNEDYAWDFCIPCKDATKDSGDTAAAWQKARLDEMAANEKSYVRNFFQMKRKLAAERQVGKPTQQ